MPRPETRAGKSADKRKALELALERLEQAFGKGAVMRLGQSGAHANIATITTGSIGLDIALGHGGLPKGRIVELRGPARCGKTTLALHILAQVQKSGGVAALVDAEHEFDPLYARNIGVDLDDLVIAEPDDGEQALEMTDTLAASGGVTAIVVDSIAVLESAAADQAAADASPVNLPRKLVGQALNKLAAACARTNCLVILINQPAGERRLSRLRRKKPPIAESLVRGAAAVRLEMERLKDIRHQGELKGCRSRVRVLKDKRRQEAGEAEFDIFYGKGISRAHELLDLGAATGALTRHGGAYYYDGKPVGGDYESAAAFLGRNDDVTGDLESAIRSWRDISRRGKLTDRSRFSPLPTDPNRFFRPTQRIIALSGVVLGVSLLVTGVLWQGLPGFSSGVMVAGGMSMVMAGLLYGLFVLPIAASRRAYQFTLDHLPVGFYSAVRDGTFTYVNKTLADMLGYDEEQLLSGQIKLGDILHDDVGNQINLSRLLSDTARSGSTRAFLRLQDGRKIAVEMAQSDSADGRDGDEVVHSVVRYVSGSDNWHETLETGSTRFHRLFTEAPIGLVVVDEDGGIINVNSIFEDMVGRIPGALRERPFDDYFVRRDRAAVCDLLATARHGEAVTKPIEARLAGEAEKDVQLLASAVQKSHGEISTVVYLVDITEYRQLEHQYATAQRMKAVGQLAGGIAHDFNNLLTAISGFSELLLQRHSDAEDPSRDAIEQIKQSADRAASLVSRLLAFSRQQTLKPEIIDVADVAEDIQDLLSRVVGENIRLEVRGAENLWPVRVDKGRLEQVLINLSVNARDAMPEGGLLTIQTMNVPAGQVADFGYPVIETGDYVLIEMADTGRGISKKHLNQIFEPFFTTKEGTDAVGLGLSMVYGIVKQSGGYIFAENRPRGGAVFRLLLPRHEAEAPRSGKKGGRRRIAETPPKRTAESRAPGKPTVLLVEDEDAVRLFACRALANRGYDVIAARDGSEALSKLDAHRGPVALMITDVVMPNMDGAELAEKVRSRGGETRIIYMSGYARDTYREKIDPDKDNFLAKPFSLDEMIECVERVMKTSDKAGATEKA